MTLEQKAILVVVDGMGDRVARDGQTPLQLASTPHLDQLAQDGCTALMNTLGPGVIPGSDTAHMALLGYDPDIYYRGRGPFEALGVGLDLEPGDVAFRCNFATVNEEYRVVDRRAGRLRDEGPELAGSLQDWVIDGVQVVFVPSTEHRGTLVLRGEGVSAAISDTDPHSPEKVPPLKARALNEDAAATRTAKVLNQVIEESHRRLADHPINQERKNEGKPPANIILTRGAGVYEPVPSLEERYGIRSCCVAGSALYKGVARYAGMVVAEVPGATGRVDTDEEAKARVALEALNDHEFVFIHLKGADNASHDGNVDDKLCMIGKLDNLVRLLSQEDVGLVVTADHSTPVRIRRHSSDPVPVLVYARGMRRDTVTSFNEVSVAHGGLGHIDGLGLHRITMDLMGVGHMRGS